MPAYSTATDVLLIGQGIAGSTLAWKLLQRGLRVAVVDRGGVDDAGRPSASRVAAGLITPITGKRLTLDPEWDKLWNNARDFYRSVEQTTGTSILEERPALRLFKSATERARFEERSADAAFLQHARIASVADIPTGLNAPHGAFVMPHAARLNTAAYLDTTRRHLEALGAYSETEFDSVDPVEARLVIFCTGYSPTEELTFQPAKGQVITIEASGVEIDRVIHRGIWIAAEGAGRYRVGSTYEWDRHDSVPTDAAREELLAGFAACCSSPVKVVEHRAAVRPTTPDRRPIALLTVPPHRQGWFNGLGAKGALLAPWYAECFAAKITARLAAGGSL